MRKIHVTLNVDEETILKESDQENLDDAISQELGWLHDSGITLENWSFADPEKERESQLINNILNYLADHYDESELYRILHDDLEMSHEEIDLLGFDLPDCYTDEPSELPEYGKYNDRRWFLEVVQYQDGTYCANMAVAGNFLRFLPEYVDYNTLKRAIRLKTGISILPKKDMIFQRSGTLNYAYIDKTQPREDCRVTLEEMNNGWMPGWASDHKEQPISQGSDPLPMQQVTDTAHHTIQNDDSSIVQSKPLLSEQIQSASSRKFDSFHDAQLQRTDTEPER